MQHHSPWKLTAGKFGSVLQDAAFDVAVIGGGITGVTTAYLLKQSGKRVCVLERDRIGSGETGRTTAHLTYQIDLRISDLVRVFGEDGATLALRGGEAAIDLIEANIRQRYLDCGFRRVPAYLHAPWRDAEDASALQRDAELAVKLGFSARYVPSVPYFNRPGIVFQDQARFEPLSYLSGLAELVDADGSAVFEQSDVAEVQEDPLRLTVGHRTIRTDYLVIATHVPLLGKSGLVSATLLQSKIFPYTSYAVQAHVPRGQLPEACFWDTADPYFYLRVDAGKGHDSVVLGGLDHKTGQEADPKNRFQGLRDRLKNMVPEARPQRTWSGQVIETNDGLPYIGESAPRQFVATGFAGNGITFGTLAAMMACDHIIGRENPWQELFSLDRKKLRGGAWDYVRENLDFPFYYVHDRLFGQHNASVKDVAAGEGKVLKLNDEWVACSRDRAGKLTMVSARCPHLGCLVRWNGAEQTWDCPCHGSRFEADGELLAGPAETPLAK